MDSSTGGLGWAPRVCLSQRLLGVPHSYTSLTHPPTLHTCPSAAHAAGRRRGGWGRAARALPACERGMGCRRGGGCIGQGRWQGASGRGSAWEALWAAWGCVGWSWGEILAPAHVGPLTLTPPSPTHTPSIPVPVPPRRRSPVLTRPAADAGPWRRTARATPACEGGQRAETGRGHGAGEVAGSDWGR